MTGFVGRDNAADTSASPRGENIGGSLRDPGLEGECLATPCSEMTDLIIQDHFLHDLEDDLLAAMERHLTLCPRCATKRLALRRATDMVALELGNDR